MHLEDLSQLLVKSKLKPEETPYVKDVSKTLDCPICFLTLPKDVFYGIGCTHLFCKGCWNAYLEIQVMHGVSTGILFSLFSLTDFAWNPTSVVLEFIGTKCMGCPVVAPEDFVLPLLATPQLKERYVRHAFSDYIRSHPELRFCPGPSCNIIIRAKENKAKRIVCHSCKTTFWYWIRFIPFHIYRSFLFNKLELIYTLVFDVEVNITLQLIAKRFDSGSPNVQKKANRPITSLLMLK